MKSVKVSVSSNLTINAGGANATTLGVGTHTNTGTTAAQAPVLMSVQADEVITADQFAQLVANGTPDLSNAFVARVLNALNEAVGDIVDEASAAPNIDFGWAKFLFEIAGSLDTATGTPGVGNYCYFSGSVIPKYQRQFALLNARTDTAASPCDLKMIRDKATSEKNVIYGTAEFYADGRGLAHEGTGCKQELYKLDGTKMCDLTLDAQKSYLNSLSLKIPASATVPVGSYVVRLDCVIAGTTYRLEKKVEVVTAVVPATPTIVKMRQVGMSSDDLFSFGTAGFTITGTNLSLATGDKVTIELWDGTTQLASNEATVASSSDTTIVNTAGCEDTSGVEPVAWEQNAAKLVVTKGGTRIEHPIVVNA